jgi:hypothetical protein
MITGAPLAVLLPSWQLSLAERDLSARTLEAYLRTGDQLVAWLENCDTRTYSRVAVDSGVSGAVRLSMHI